MLVADRKPRYEERDEALEGAKSWGRCRGWVGPECTSRATSARTMDSSNVVVTGVQAAQVVELPAEREAGACPSYFPTVSNFYGKEAAVSAENERSWKFKVEGKACNSSFGERKIE